MITPSDAASAAPPLPTSLPPLNVSPSSLGSKFAAHFTPLRSPSKSLKPRQLVIENAVDNPTRPSVGKLSLPVDDVLGSSGESPRSSLQSRSTTPRPHHVPQSVVVRGDDGEDYSDLFLRPHQLEKSLQATKTASTKFSPKGSLEDPPTSPTPPTSPCLQFPVPPPMVGRPSITALDKNQSRRPADLLSKELGTKTLKGSNIASRSLASSKQSDTGSERTILSDHLSSDGHARNRNRAISHSGSDTDASRAYDSSPRVSRIKQTPGILRSSSIKQPSSYHGTGGKAAGGQWQPCPLPSPPLSPPSSASSSMIPTISSVSNAGALQRPRANTLSSVTLLGNRSTALQPIPSTSTTYQKAFASENKATPGISPDASPEELREALNLQRKKYAQLQEYIITITKRYEDDRVALTKTVEKLEHDIRKKTREIEGLRWLVIHHGAVEDIDAAANLARSSLTLDESDIPDTDRESSSGASRRGRPLPANQGSDLTTAGQRGLGAHSNHTRQSSLTTDVVPTLENFSAASSQTSLTLGSHPAPAKSLSAIPERPSLPGSPEYNISRAERQQAKEDRRATRALRSVSGSSGSSFSSGANLLMHSSTDGSFNPKRA